MFFRIILQKRCSAGNLGDFRWRYCRSKIIDFSRGMFTEICDVFPSGYRRGFKSANVKCTSTRKKAPWRSRKRWKLVCMMNYDANWSTFKSRVSFGLLERTVTQSLLKNYAYCLSHNRNGYNLQREN